MAANTTNNLNLLPKWATPVSVNAIDSILTVSGLGALLNSRTTNMWFYYIIKGVLNPSVYINQTFSIIYSEGTTVNSIADWVLNTPLVYYISATPSFMVVD
jgi:hypothetical protein